MSKQSLGQFVHRLHLELESYKEYRKLLNLEPHTFVFNKRTLVTQTKKQLLRGAQSLPREVEVEIQRLANIYGDKLISQLENIAGAKLPKPGGKVTLIFSEDTEVPLPSYYKMSPLHLPVFSRVKIAYREILNEFFNELQVWLEKNAEEYLVKNKDGRIKKSIRGFFDAGHEEGYGVFERFIDEATLKIAEELNHDTNIESQAARDRLVSELNNMGVALDIKKSPTTDSIIIKIESSYLNRSRGAKTGQDSKILRKKILDFIEKNPLEDLKGSDSIKTKKRKEVISKTIKPFKKIQDRDIIVKTENLKINLSDSSSKTTKKSSIKGVALKATYKKSGKATKIRTKKSFVSLQALIPTINERLPAILERNMKAPALENRTGRFLSSVRVTDIIQTPRGYPSIGYTYQRNPYEVYESSSGSRFADHNRDPRGLIDKSIREAAATLAIGRFYTRRV
jgi:hypothetical protein